MLFITGKALLLRATQTSEGSSSISTAKDTVQNAHSLGVRVEHFTKFLKECNKLLQKIKQSSPAAADCAAHRDKSEGDITPINWKTQSRIILKFEDSDTSFKPIFKQFDKAQRLNYNSECGSPFVEGVVLRRQEKHENRYSTRKKTQNVAPKGGFCEACDYWYNCHLREHLLSDRHQNYSSNLDNFLSLNSIVNEMPDFNAFITRYRTSCGKISGASPVQPRNIISVQDKNLVINDVQKALSGNQPMGFSSESQSFQPVALNEIIHKLDKAGCEIKSQTTVQQVSHREQKTSDISWENGVNKSSRTSIHSNDVHMQTIARRDCSSQKEQITNVRKKLMSCSLVHHSDTTDHESEKTEEYEVENVLSRTTEQTSIHGIENNANSSMTEEYECTQKSNNLSSENKTEEYELPKVCSRIGLMNGCNRLSFSSDEAGNTNCELSKCADIKRLGNGLKTVATRLDGVSESDRDVSMMSEISMNSGTENTLDNTVIETRQESFIKSIPRTKEPKSSHCHPFANITNFWQSEKAKRNEIYRKQLDKSSRANMTLNISNTEENLKSKKRKHSIEDDADTKVYYSCKANGTKLKLCKVVTPVRKKADIRQYWKVRKAGGCRLVFSAEKRKDLPKPPCLQSNCSPVVKRRKCLF